MTSKGGPYFALTSAAQEALMVCKHCTYCCNALNECLFQEEAWPKLIDPFHNENFKMILDKIPFGIGYNFVFSYFNSCLVSKLR